MVRINKFKMNKRMEELCLCALAQNYGKDLRPLYKNPVVDLGLYLKLREILR